MDKRKLNYLMAQTNPGLISNNVDMKYLKDLISALEAYGLGPTDIAKTLKIDSERNQLRMISESIEHELLTKSESVTTGVEIITDVDLAKVIDMDDNFPTMLFNTKNLKYGIVASITLTRDHGIFFGNNTQFEWHKEIDGIRITLQYNYEEVCEFILPVILIGKRKIFQSNVSCVFHNNTEVEYLIGQLDEDKGEIVIHRLIKKMPNVDLLQKFMLDIPIGLPVLIGTDDLLELWTETLEVNIKIGLIERIQNIINVTYEEQMLHSSIASASAASGIYALTKVDQLSKDTIVRKHVIWQPNIKVTDSKLPIIFDQNGVALNDPSHGQNTDIIDVECLSVPITIFDEHSQGVGYPVLCQNHSLLVEEKSYAGGASFNHQKWNPTKVKIDMGYTYSAVSVLGLSDTVNYDYTAARIIDGKEEMFPMSMYIVNTQAIMVSVKNVELQVTDKKEFREPVTLHYLPYACMLNYSELNLKHHPDSGKLVILCNRRIPSEGNIYFKATKEFDLQAIPTLHVDIKVDDLMPTANSFEIQTDLIIKLANSELNMSVTKLLFREGTYLQPNGTAFNGYRAVFQLTQEAVKQTIIYETSTELPRKGKHAAYGRNFVLRGFPDLVGPRDDNELYIVQRECQARNWKGPTSINLGNRFERPRYYDPNDMNPIANNYNDASTYIPDLPLSGGYNFLQAEGQDDQKKYMRGILPKKRHIEDIAYWDVCFQNKTNNQNYGITGGEFYGSKRFYVPISHYPTVELKDGFYSVGIGMEFGSGPNTTNLVQSNSVLAPLDEKMNVTFYKDYYITLPVVANLRMTSLKFKERASVLGNVTYSVTGAINGKAETQTLALPAGIVGLGLIDERFSRHITLLEMFNTLFSDILTRVENLEDRTVFIQSQINNIKQVLTEIIESMRVPEQSTLQVVANVISLFGNALSVFLPLVGTSLVILGMVFNGIEKIQHGDVMNGALEITVGALMAGYGGHKLLQRITRKYNLNIPMIWKEAVRMKNIAQYLGSRWVIRNVRNVLHKGKNLKGFNAARNSSKKYKATEITNANDSTLTIEHRIVAADDWSKVFDWWIRTEMPHLTNHPDPLGILTSRHVVINEGYNGIASNVKDVTKLTVKSDTLSVKEITTRDYYKRLCNKNDIHDDTLNLTFRLACRAGEHTAKAISITNSAIYAMLAVGMNSAIGSEHANEKKENSFRKYFNNDYLVFKNEPQTYIHLNHTIKALSLNEPELDMLDG